MSIFKRSECLLQFSSSSSAIIAYKVSFTILFTQLARPHIKKKKNKTVKNNTLSELDKKTILNYAFRLLNEEEDYELFIIM